MPRTPPVVLALLPLLAAARAAIPVPPGYVCHRATTAPVIDGRIDDAIWKDVAWTSDFGDIEGAAKPAPVKRTRVKMLWDDRYLYIAAEMEEPDLMGTIRERDAVIFKDNDFEVFVDPAGDGRSYVELEMNALNTVWDLFLTRPYRENGHALHDWDMRGLKTAVRLDGTLNKPGDKDRGWTAEIAIPWSALRDVSSNPRTNTPPAPGSEMRINFSRVEWNFFTELSSPSGYTKWKTASGVDMPEMNWTWAPTYAVDMHRPEFWGVLRFSANPPERREGYVPDPDETLRAELFRLYREQAAYRAKNGAYAADIAAWCDTGDTIRGRKLSELVRFENAGGLRYAIVAESPFTGDTWTIVDDGVVSRQRAPEAVRRARMFKVWSWVHGGDKKRYDAAWNRLFADARRAGVDAVLIEGSVADVSRLAAMARAAGLEAHAWFWTMNRVGDAEAMKHPDWFVVNRKGESAHDKPAYVDYYRFLCPTNPEVRAHLRRLFAEYASIPDVAGVQMDYVRLPDVILPRGLWSHYGLVMDREMPAYDYCYCPRCLAAFREKYGRAPAEDPTRDVEWRRFREDAVSGVVAGLREEADAHGKLLEAAVFPYPSLAASMVRQDWDRWPLDLALPMTYNAFYEEPLPWVGKAVRRGMQENGGRFPLQAGVYLPDVPADKLGEHVREVFASGAAGVAVFQLFDLDETRRAELRRTLDEIRR